MTPKQKLRWQRDIDLEARYGCAIGAPGYSGSMTLKERMEWDEREHFGENVGQPGGWFLRLFWFWRRWMCKRKPRLN